MPTRRFDPRRIKQNRSYDVGELAACCGVHKNTVRQWQRAGLKTLDDKRPIMFHGDAVRAFLGARKASRRCLCPPGTIYCFRCRAARQPTPGPIGFVPVNASSGNVRATCETCGTLMHRRVRQAALAAIFPDRRIQIKEGQERL